MWIVAKVKKKELNNFKINLIKKIGKETKFYQPKIVCHKYFGGKFKNIKIVHVFRSIPKFSIILI